MKYTQKIQKNQKKITTFNTIIWEISISNLFLGVPLFLDIESAKLSKSQYFQYYQDDWKLSTVCSV